MADVNLKLLRTFESFARLRLFTRAAAELRRAQATVASQVSALETQLDVALLKRTSRRIALTEAGEALAVALAPAFHLIDEGLANARDALDRRRGRIVIACMPSLASVLLPTVLADDRKRDRTTRIDVEELTSEEILQAVVDGTIDFAIGPVTSGSTAAIAFTAAVEASLCVLFPASQVPEDATEIPFYTLASLPLITLSGSVLLQRQLQAAADASGVTLGSKSEVRHVQTAISMVQAGFGAAIVPRMALPATISEGLRALPISAPALSRMVGIVARKGVPVSPAAARLARHFRSSLARRAAPPKHILAEPMELTI